MNTLVRQRNMPNHRATENRSSNTQVQPSNLSSDTTVQHQSPYPKTLSFKASPTPEAMGPYRSASYTEPKQSYPLTATLAARGVMVKNPMFLAFAVAIITMLITTSLPSPIIAIAVLEMPRSQRRIVRTMNSGMRNA